MPKAKKPTEEKVEKLSEADYEKKVVELAKKGLTSEKIGESLRKQKIHPKEYTKKISKILKEKDLYVSPDEKNIASKLEKINVHNVKNKQDKKSMREKGRIFSQLRKLRMYLAK